MLTALSTGLPTIPFYQPGASYGTIKQASNVDTPMVITKIPQAPSGAIQLVPSAWQLSNLKKISFIAQSHCNLPRPAINTVLMPREMPRSMLALSTSSNLPVAGCNIITPAASNVHISSLYPRSLTRIASTAPDGVSKPPESVFSHHGNISLISQHSEASLVVLEPHAPSSGTQIVQSIPSGVSESIILWDPWILQNNLAACGRFQWRVYLPTPWLPGLMLEVHSSSDLLHSIDLGSSMLSDGNVTIIHYANRGMCSPATCTRHHQPSSNAASDTPRRVVGHPAAARVWTGHCIKASLLDQSVIQHCGTLSNPQVDMIPLGYRFNSMKTIDHRLLNTQSHTTVPTPFHRVSIWPTLAPCSPNQAGIALHFMQNPSFQRPPPQLTQT